MGGSARKGPHLAKFSSQLTRLLVIRGVARAIMPIFVIWGIYDWYLVRPLYALIFALLSTNYILVYAISWTAPHLLNGPWRIRPWQTFVLLGSAIALPIIYKRHFGQQPWGYIAMSILMVVGLYVATAILFHLNDRLPMGGIFMARRGGYLKPPPPPPGSQAAKAADNASAADAAEPK
jgi:hypothetical protein